MRGKRKIEVTQSCKACNGTGVVEAVDWVDYGSTSVSMTTTEYCSECVQESHCPKCGSVVGWDEDEDRPLTCTHCGWDVYAQISTFDVAPKPYKPLTSRQVAILTHINGLDGLDSESAHYPENVAKALGYLLQEIDGDLDELAERKCIQIFSPSGQHAPTMLFSLNQ